MEKYDPREGVVSKDTVTTLKLKELLLEPHSA